MRTRRELVEFYAALKVAETLKGKSENIVKFLYAVDKNLTKLSEEIKSMKKSMDFLPLYEKYDTERIKLCKSMAKKDKKGKPLQVFKHGKIQYDLFEEDSNEYKQEFVDALDSLKEEHTEAFIEREKQTEDYNKMLDEEFAIEIYKVPLSFVPADVAEKGVNKGDGSQSALFKLLLPMIVEE